MYDHDADESERGGLRLGDSLRHRKQGPGKAAVTGSVLLHAAAVGAFLVAGIAGRSDLPEFETVAINLVSPPPTVKGPPEPVETTAPVVTEPAPPEPTPEPVEKPKPTTQAAVPKPVVSKPEKVKPAQGENPEPVAVGGEDLNIQREGVPFPFPEYLVRIETQLPRYLRAPPGTRGLSAEVVFSIRRDGSTRDIELTRSSGNFDFDVKAVEAVERAGRARFAGPLPDAYQNDRLLIRYTFVPAN